MEKKDSLDYDAEIQKMEERLNKLTECIRMEESRIGSKLDDLMRAIRHNNCKPEHVNRNIRNSRQDKQKPTANMSESDAIMKQLGKVYGTLELAENLDEALRRISEAHIVLQRFLSASNSQSIKLQIENFLVRADKMKRILIRIKHSMVHTSVLDTSPVSDDDQLNQPGTEQCPSSASASKFSSSNASH